MVGKSHFLGYVVSLPVSRAAHRDTQMAFLCGESHKADVLVSLVSPARGKGCLCINVVGLGFLNLREKRGLAVREKGAFTL